MSLYRDHGVVLRTYKLGESDRIVVFLTVEHGKVRAVAKGVRKPASRFGGRLEPISHVALQLWRGRELDIVSQAESVDHFRVLRDDLDRIGKATAMLEVCDQVAQEREPNPRLYQMLIGALRTLDASDSATIVPAFFWKVLAAEGLHPELDSCVSCGGPDQLASFGIDEGGLLCRTCRAHAHGVVVPIHDDTLDLVRRVLGGALTSVLAVPACPATQELEVLATRAMEHHLERRLKAPAVLHW
jgi:DNA repair protein RecO (recombination protein O)